MAFRKHQSKFKHVHPKTLSSDFDISNLRTSTAPHKTGNLISCSHSQIVFASSNNDNSSLGLVLFDQLQHVEYLSLCKGQVSDVSCCRQGGEGRVVAVGTQEGKVLILKRKKDATTLEPVHNISHNNKISRTVWNPSAEHIISCSSGTTISTYNVEHDTTHDVSIDVGGKNIDELEWDACGNCVISVCEQNIAKLVDVRSSSVVQQFDKVHSGRGVVRISTGLGELSGGCFYTSGMSAVGQREVAIWDTRKGSSESISRKVIDYGTSTLVPSFDSDSSLLCLVGRGDTSCVVLDTSSDLSILSKTALSKHLSIGFAMAPKPRLDVFDCEVGRVLNLTSSGIEQTALLVPRRQKRYFQPELFPDTISPLKPALTATEWQQGQSALPTRIPVLELQAKLGLVDSDHVSEYPQEYMEDEKDEDEVAQKENDVIDSKENVKEDTTKEEDLEAQKKMREFLGYIPKFKNIAGKQAKKDESIYNLSGVNPSCFALGETKFALPFTGGGGPILVGDLTDVGKMAAPDKLPLLNGHSRSVLSLAFSPFDEKCLASGSDDFNILVWRLADNIADSTSVKLDEHTGSVKNLQFHPLASNTLISAADDGLINIWDANECKLKTSVTIERSLCSWDFNYNGETMVYMMRENNSFQLLDPRSSNNLGSAVSAHEGTRSSFVKWVGNSPFLLTSGQDHRGEREFKMWDSRKLENCVNRTVLGTGTNSMEPHLIEDNGVVIFTAKGESTFKIYELQGLTAVDQDKNSHCIPHFCDSFTVHGDPIIAASMLPRRTCDTATTEVAKLCCLTKSSIERVSFRIPRAKALGKYFADDLYPEARSNKSDLTVDEWFTRAKTVPGPVTINLNTENKALFSLNSGKEISATKHRAKQSADRFKQEKELAEQRDRERDQLFKRFENLAAQHEEYEKSYQKQLDSCSEVDSDEWDD